MPDQRKLDDWITSYLQYTSTSEPRETFRLFSGLSAVAACLRRKCHSNWEEPLYPNLYIVLVGPPAARKNTAIAPAERMLRQIGIPVSAQATTPEALIRKLRKVSEFVTPSDDSILTASDAAMTIISKEFTVFLGIRNLQLISYLCEWYDCDPNWTYDTKTQGTDEIKNVWMNLIAGTTPTALKDSLPRESVGMGLTSRIIFVFEEDKDKIVFFSPNVDVYDEKTQQIKKLNFSQHQGWEILHDDLIHDLTIISMMNGTFIPTGNYHKAYMEWRHESETNMPFKGTMLENYANRRQTHIRKLSMVYSASRSDDMLMRLEDFERAVKALELVEVKMNMSFSGIGKSDVAETTSRVMQTMARMKRMTFKELQKMFWNDADKVTLEKIVQTCEVMGVCKREFKGMDIVIVYQEEKNDRAATG